MPAPNVLQNIDFLPAEYRQQTDKRKGMPYRLIIVAICAVLVGLAQTAQTYFARRAKAELAEVNPQYDMVLKLNAQLSDLQTKAQNVRAAADLHAYLRHPWPASQLLAAIYACVPEPITLNELRIRRDASRGNQGPARSLAERQAEEQAQAKLPPAMRDLKSLRDAFDRSTTTIQLTGITDSGPAVHRFLAELAENDLFTKVVLLSMENAGAESGDRLRFSATIEVRPGYGQPGGPPLAKSPPTAAVASASTGAQP